MKRFLPFLILGGLVFIYFPTLMKMYDLHKKNEDYARQIQEMKQKNIDLTEELRMLNDDPMYLEKVAREKMGLTKEGEVIYKIMPQN